GYAEGSAEVADAERTRADGSTPLGLSLTLEDRPRREEVGAEMLIELRIATPQPLQRHRGVLLLLVPVVHQDRRELPVVGGLCSLAVPVDRLELLHDR